MTGRRMPLQTWLGAAIVSVFLIVVAAGILTNVTLRSVEKNLPATLLTELNALSLVLADLAEVVWAAEITRENPKPAHFARLRGRVGAVYDRIVSLRQTYVFDNLVQASALHAVVAPAIADLQIWLSEGVSGFGPETQMTADIVWSRISEAHRKARSLNAESQIHSQRILEEQRRRLDRFLLSANLLFVLTLLISFILVFLLIRQRILQRREAAALSELRRTEQSLQESLELFRKLIAAMPDLVVRTDLQGQILFVNDAALRTGGYEKQEIEGENLLQFIDPEDHARVVENMRRMFDRPLGPKEYRFVTKSGKLLPFEVNADVLRDPDGTPYGMVNICRDVTERQRMTEERQRLEERLHRAEKMEALGTMAGGVAHDLNNVLGVLVGYAELMLLDIPEGHRLRGHVNNILQSGQRGAAIIQDLLTLARRGVAVADVVNLNDIVAEYGKTPEFEKLRMFHPGVDVRMDLQQDLLNIQGSPVHLAKTVMNLVSNAVEAIPDRGEVWIRTENRHIDKPLAGCEDMRPGDYAALTVSDNGKGIPPQDMDKIFEPFYTKKVMGRSGTGLGLAVVWGAVKDHHGHLDVQSAEGKGSVFTALFPATRRDVAGRPQRIPPEEYRGRGESILVVDDVPEQRELAANILKRLGYRVSTVPGGEEAVARLAAEPADLVILDMIMDPGIDGLETYERILKIRPGQPAILVSGFSETDRVKKAQRLGAGPYVRKPYLYETIGLAVRREMDRGRA